MEDQRPHAERKPSSRCLTQEEKQLIIKTVNQKEYQSLPPSQIVPALADQGTYIASESSFYRVMREHGLQNHRGKAHKPANQPLSTHRATGPNEVWSWDITYLAGPIQGIFFYLYLILDIYSRDIVGWEVWSEESAEHASQLIRKAVMAQGILTKFTPLVLHSDNGSPMKGATMLETLYKLGIIASRSRPRVSNDNPYSESLFKTCKYRPEYPSKGFTTLEDARNWVKEFVQWYRFSHRHSGIQFITPHQVHTHKAEGILEERRKIYKLAKERHPERWSRHCRKWELPSEVWLNPETSSTKSKTSEVL